MGKTEELKKDWNSRLMQELTHISEVSRASIIKWLMGENPEKFNNLDGEHLAVIEQGMDYRYRILKQRYLSVGPTQAYRNLLNRLGSVVTLRNKIRTWVALSRDRQRAVVDVLQEVIQEMLRNDRYIQGQMLWLNQCTRDERLKNSILFAIVEEYSLRPIRNQPLLAYRFVNYLRRQSRGGMTQVPQQEMIRILSEEIGTDEENSTLSLLDNQAIAQYEDAQNWEAQQALRLKVQKEFEDYLMDKVGQEAVDWLRLYLSGRSQEAIAERLKLPIKQVYRLREKVSYHAIKGFALKGKPELVSHWLEISLKENNLGLTPQQWASYWQNLTTEQQGILSRLKSGQSLEDIAQEFNWKNSKIMGEWSELYLAAQTLRSES